MVAVIWGVYWAIFCDINGFLANTRGAVSASQPLHRNKEARMGSFLNCLDG